MSPAVLFVLWFVGTVVVVAVWEKVSGMDEHLMIVTAAAGSYVDVSCSCGWYHFLSVQPDEVEAEYAVHVKLVKQWESVRDS